MKTKTGENMLAAAIIAGMALLAGVISFIGPILSDWMLS